MARRNCGIQGFAGWCLDPQIDHVESVEFLEAARVLGYSFAGIHVGQCVRFQRERRQLAGDAEQGGRTARHQSEGCENERPAIATCKWEQRIDEAGVSLSDADAFGAQWCFEQRLQCGEQGEAADPGDDQPACGPQPHLADWAYFRDGESCETDRRSEHRGGGWQEFVGERACVMFERGRRVVRLHVSRVEIHERRCRRDHDGQWHERRNDRIGPAENSRESYTDSYDGAQGEDDCSQGAEGAVDDEYQRDQKDAEQGHEFLGGHTCLFLEPGVEPWGSDAADGGKWAVGFFLGQDERVDGG